jgi:hypothetical protein
MEEEMTKIEVGEGLTETHRSDKKENRDDNINSSLVVFDGTVTPLNDFLAVKSALADP